MESLVSAIITTRNRSSLLTGAIESVLAQTYKHLECIVVDDASTDNTTEVCKAYPVKYIRISKEESHGGNYARNLGIKASQGEYCAFLDDDDRWMPEKIEKQIALAKEKGSSLVYCQRQYQFVENGKVVNSVNDRVTLPSGDLSGRIFRHYITNTSCLLAKKSTLEKVGLFDENLLKWQEYDLMIRMAMVTEIFYVDECLCLYTINRTDKLRISNDFQRVPKTISYFRRKYANRINNLGMRNRFGFEHLCIGELFIFAKKNRMRKVQAQYFIPFYFLSFVDMCMSPKYYFERLGRRLARQ